MGVGGEDGGLVVFGVHSFVGYLSHSTITIDPACIYPRDGAPFAPISNKE